MRLSTALRLLLAIAVSGVLILAAGTVQAGKIFLTGHDPDFHSQDGGAGGTGAQNLFKSGLAFATGGTYSGGGVYTLGAGKFLWVESRIAVPGGHRVGELGLGTLGLTLGVQYDRANAVEFASVNLSNYTAIAIASSFGGLLGRAELDALIARSTDIANFINAGGGLFASSECDNCGADLLGLNPNLFGYLPVAVTSIGAAPPFTVTPTGAAAPFNLVNSDLNSPTHNSFGLVGGLSILDRDSAQNATTLAGNVTVGGGGFTPAPEPMSSLLLAIGLAGMASVRARMRRTIRPAPARSAYR